MTEHSNYSSALDVLAEAALFYSNDNNQENNSRSINYSIGPKKLIQYRYEAEKNHHHQNSSKISIDFNNNDRLFSYGYASSSSNESNDNHSLTSSTELRTNFELSNSSSNYTSNNEQDNTVSIVKRTTTKIKSKTKKVNNNSNSSRSKKNSTTSTTSSNSISTTSSTINKDEHDCLISIKSKDTLNCGDDDNVFDDENDLKILVKTPKLSYTLRGMRKRKPSTKTPDNLKDFEYYEKRRRNNEAAKRSRNNKNLAVEQSAIRLKQLEAERIELELELGKEIMMMKFIQDKMQKDEQLNERVLNFIEENEFKYFTDVLKLDIDQ